LKEKNRSIFITILFVISFFTLIRLGFWQLDRADQKNEINQNFIERQSEEEITDQGLINEENIWRKFTLDGEFLKINFFLDNQMYRRNAGYTVFTPFVTSKGMIILVNRGWHPLPELRDEIPFIENILGPKTITGILSPIPSHGIILTDQNTELIDTNSVRIQRMDLDEIKNMIEMENLQINPLILTLDKPIDQNLVKHLVLPVSNSEKNYGYAFQWFAFAATLLIIFIVLRKKTK
jgi:surfeit locus 1 family protein